MTDRKPQAPAPAPSAKSRDQRIKDLVVWVDEQRLIDGVELDDAVRSAIDAAMPDDPKGPVKLLTTGQEVFLLVIAVIAFAIVAPYLIWAVRNGLVPLWIWAIHGN